MANEPQNLVLEYLRKPDARLEEMHDDLRDVKARLTGVEENLAGVHRRLDLSDA